MANICENNIDVTCSNAEWEEISNGLEKDNINWSLTYDGIQTWGNKSISCSTKWSPRPIEEGYMSSLSKMYPTALFKYSYDIEGGYGGATCYFINGKDYKNKKSADKECDKAIGDYFKRLSLQSNEHAEGINHIIELMPQGIVAADGENRFGECDIYSFENITQVSCGDWHTVVLDENGKAYSCGSNYNGQCNVPQSNGRIKKISCGRYHTIFLFEDGTIHYSGSVKKANSELSSWENIKDVCAVYDGVIAIDKNNQLLIWGNTACNNETCKTFFDELKTDDIIQSYYNYKDTLSNEEEGIRPITTATKGSSSSSKKESSKKNNQTNAVTKPAEQPNDEDDEDFFSGIESIEDISAKMQEECDKALKDDGYGFFGYLVYGVATMSSFGIEHAEKALEGILSEEFMRGLGVKPEFITIVNSTLQSDDEDEDEERPGFMDFCQQCAAEMLERKNIDNIKKITKRALDANVTNVDETGSIVNDFLKALSGEAEKDSKSNKKQTKSAPKKTSTAKSAPPKTPDESVDFSSIGDLDPQCFKIQGTVLVKFFKKYLKKNKDIIIPEGVTAISNNAFWEQKELTGVKLPSTLKSIGNDAFTGCYSLKQILIPKSVEEIGESPFSGCKSLEKIEVEEGNEHFKSVDGVLYSADMSRLISYPGAKSGESFETPESVKYIGKSAFSSNMNIKTIVLNKGLEALGIFAFSWSKSLTDVVINGGLKELPMWLFFRCASLENVTIAEGVEKIGQDSFDGCESLKRVVIPESVKILDECHIQNNPDLVIVCKENSAAHKYCINNKIACEIDGVAQPAEKKKSEMTDEEILEAPMTAKEKAVVEREKQLYSKSLQALDLIEKTNEIANSLNMPVDLDDVADYFKKFEMFNGAEDDDILLSLRRDGIAAASRVCDNVDKLSGEVRETYEMAIARQEEEEKAAVARKVAEDTAAERKTAAAAAAARDQQSKTQPASQSQTNSPQNARQTNNKNTEIKQTPVIADVKSEKGQSSHEIIPSASKKEKNSKKVAIVIAIIFALLLLLYFVFTSIIPTSNYNKAVELINNKQYSEAGKILKNWSSNKYRSDVKELIDKYGINFCEVGDVVYFGHSETYGANDNQIRWKVVDKKDGKVLLIMDNFRNERKQVVKNWNGILQPFDDYNENAVWSTCTLNKWLNNDFYNSVFSDEEKEMIIAGENGSGVNEKVFVLSSSEFSQYFPASEMYGRYTSAFDDTFYSGWLRDGKYYCLKGSKTSTYLTADSYDTKSSLTVYPAIWVDIES